MPGINASRWRNSLWKQAISLKFFEKSQFFLKHISIRIWRSFSRDQLHGKKGIKESESDAPLETVNLAHFLTCHKLLIDKLFPFKNWKARKETKIKVAPFISIRTVLRFASAVRYRVYGNRVQSLLQEWR